MLKITKIIKKINCRNCDVECQDAGSTPVISTRPVCGGTGRRDRLKIYLPRGSVGSIPIRQTKKRKISPFGDFFILYLLFLLKYYRLVIFGIKKTGSRLNFLKNGFSGYTVIYFKPESLPFTGCDAFRFDPFNSNDSFLSF